MSRSRVYFQPSPAALFLAALFAFLCSGPQPAAAAAPTALLESLGKCLTVPGDAGADGAVVVLSTCADRVGQAWQLPPRGHSGLIVGPGGKCLDVSGGNPADRTPIIVFSCHGLPNQVWRHEVDGRIVGLADKCLDVLASGTADGTPVVLFPCTPTPNQLWRAEQVNQFHSEPLLSESYFLDLAASPLEPARLFAAAAWSGILRSENDGRDWAAANAGLSLASRKTQVAVAPLDPERVYLIDEGRLFRSLDGGARFLSVPAAPAGLRSIAFDPRHSGHLMLTDGALLYLSIDGGQYYYPRQFPFQQSPGTLQQVLYDPQVEGRLWIAAAATCAFCTGPDQGVYRSDNDGETWTRVFDLPTGRIVADPHGLGNVYALVDKQLFRTTNGGGSWQLLANFAGALTDVWVDSASPGRIVVAHQAGLSRSSDGGASFVPVDNGFRAGEYVRRLLRTDGRLFAAVDSTDGHPGRGLLASADFGATWSRPNNRGLATGLVADVEKVAGAFPAIWVATRDGVWLSTDGGVRFSRSLAVEGPAEAAAIQVDPYDTTRKTVYVAGNRQAGATSPFLWKTTNGGVSWQGVAGSDLEIKTGAFAVTQYAGKKIYLTTLQGFFGGTNYQGILSSENGGPWKPLQLGTRLSLLVNGPVDGLLYATGEKVLRSTDGGQHWSTLLSLPFPAMASFGEELFVADADQFLFSHNRGTSFQVYDLPPAIGEPTVLLATASRLFLGDAAGGVYASTDRGKTWVSLDLGLPAARITSLEIDPLDATRLYAGTFGSGLHRVRIAPEPPLRFARDRFTAKIRWRDFLGQTGSGEAAAWTDDTGYFWFFAPENVEVMVKVLDGRFINDAFWVFVGSLSNVEFTLTVRDEWTGEERTYENPLGSFASFGDIGAFPEPGTVGRPPAPASAALADPAPLTAAAAPAAPAVGLATPAPDGFPEISINDRFAVRVTWEDGFGQTGFGLGRRMTNDTAAFTFFSETNTELVIKVLDGTAINGHYWVFYGALSNVGYVITIRDSVTGQQVIYQNPVGTFASVGDISAF